MKTILYNPIFINPQAYYVFPRLTRYLQPDNESTAEPANYIGTIEVKVIAYGDTTLKRTYTNTDSIDLSEFKNTWIRISLFTKVGSCVLGEWKIGNMESDLPYIDPEVLASLKAVVIVGNKTNNDSDRAIVKNLVDPDNPFVISNAAYTEGSGYADKGSPYYGAFVTDGVNDLITSTKTVQEMLGGSNEITVVSMIHLVQTPSASSEKAYTNQIRTGQNYLRNYVTNNGKTGIYGYTYKENNVSVINNILGDKNDYTVENKSWNNLAKFSVIGYEDNGTINELDQVAWYWTIIANKVLTTDQINQVIAYFNLDRTLKPDILCNTIKQGITNENHAEFGDKLIDFSGNGRDIQLNNIAWDGDSGIGKYNYPNWKVTATIANTYSTIVNYPTVNGTYSINVNGVSELMQSIGLHLEIKYTTSTGIIYNDIKQDGVYSYILPDGATDLTLRFGGIPGIVNEPCNITITQIPSHAGGLCLDGVNDFGKVTGMPVYKDYTFIIDYERISYASSERWVAGVVSKSHVANQGAFILMTANTEVEPGKQAYSFGGVTSFNRDDFTRALLYQSKYKCGDVDLTVGEGVDSDTLWLGTFRGNDQRFFNGAIYSLMSFPYSMSKFLIERQLKKYKLGTLYPNMVEFRPIIKSNIDILKINYWDKDWNVVNVGDYVSVGNDIKTNITVPNGYKVSKVTSDAFDNITIEKSSTEFIYDVKFYGIKKSPQKIGITIEQDENYVLFNPVITSNVEYHKLDFYLNNYQKRINIGDYIPKDAYLRANFYLKNNVDELTAFIFNGVNIGYRRSSVDDTAFNIGHIYNYDSPQEVNITIDEYIRYEDIVQPYPVIFQITDRNTNQRYSWGDKIKVGSSIRLSQGEKPNLLSGLYSIQSYEYEGETYSYNQLTNLNIILTKQSISLSCNKTWLLDDNEPKCILSPRLLRIPNSSYKILGYIPDISGHGNHGKINNSAYEGMSGVNGYPVVFGENKTWANESNGYVTSITSNTIHITNVLNAGLALLYSYVKYNGNLQNIKEIPPFKIEIKGLEGRSKFIYKYLATSDATKETNLYLGNGTHELPKSFLPTEALINNAVVGFSISPIEEGVTNFLSDITIKVLPEYEGAYCLDGVDDFVTIPTTVGGKQVLMKVNWDSPNASILYDQRGYNNEFAIYNGTNDSDGNPIPAYQGRNNGQTYIDGILNSNIKALELRAITHNITITNELSSGANKTYPIIGSSKSNAYFVNMALYDFMLFDEISTDDKILELNEYVGIEGNTE